jgi:nitric oxide dioxygenase
MIDQKTIDIVKQTAPVIQQTGPKLTAHFYERMFAHNPELKEIFNMSNQRNGDQREALFNAICAYANNIDNLEVLLGAVEKIAQKHTSFLITETQYNIVGHHLLATIDELLAPGQEVIDAWAEAYGVLANVFIQREEQIYKANQQLEGGWRGQRDFIVVDKNQESSLITSFVFEPIDQKPVAHFEAGQYIGIYIKDSQFENQEIRQYSLSNAPNGRSYRISVKREQEGKVSNFLHQKLNVGDTVQLVPPSGDFYLKNTSKKPVVLLSAGVGLTPMLCMLEQLSASDSRQVNWLHATQNGSSHAFKHRISTLAADNSHITSRVWYEQPLNSDEQGQDFDVAGRMNLAELALPQDAEYYFCGPIGFMKSIASQLQAKGIDESQLHYEVFGPHKII